MSTANSRLPLEIRDPEPTDHLVQPPRVQKLVDRVVCVSWVVRAVVVIDQLVTSGLAGEASVVIALRDFCREDLVPPLDPIGQRPGFTRPHAFSGSNHSSQYLGVYRLEMTADWLTYG